MAETEEIEETGEIEEIGETGEENDKVLVAYFSATGKIKMLAEYAADANAMGADLYEIMPDQSKTP